MNQMSVCFLCVLGDTIEKIAIQKAGIFKRNKPSLIGVNCPHDVLQASIR
jgi:folylpolyglutamate synthase/dihydropteroate synthase